MGHGRRQKAAFEAFDEKDPSCWEEYGLTILHQPLSTGNRHLIALIARPVFLNILKYIMDRRATITKTSRKYAVVPRPVVFQCQVMIKARHKTGEKTPCV